MSDLTPQQEEAVRWRCQNCAEIWTDNQVVDAKNLFSRHGVGDAFSDKECPAEDCGALCFPEHLYEQWKLEHAAAALLQELRNIATARPWGWNDPTDFTAWAQSRARYAIRQATGEEI